MLIISHTVRHMELNYNWPSRIRQDIYVPSAPPQFPNDINVTDHHDESRCHEEDHELIDRKDKIFIRIFTIVDLHRDDVVGVDHAVAILQGKRIVGGLD